MTTEIFKKPYVLLPLGVILGFLAGWLVFSVQNVALQKQITAVKKFFPSGSGMIAVNGTITDVSGNTITVRSHDLPRDPFEQLPTTRKVHITDTTKITVELVKTPAQLQSEALTSQKAPPVPFVVRSGTMSDLTVNALVNVQAASNIATSTDFDAVSISVQEVPTASTSK